MKRENIQEEIVELMLLLTGKTYPDYLYLSLETEDIINFDKIHTKMLNAWLKKHDKKYLNNYFEVIKKKKHFEGDQANWYYMPITSVEWLADRVIEGSATNISIDNFLNEVFRSFTDQPESNDKECVIKAGKLIDILNKWLSSIDKPLKDKDIKSLNNRIISLANYLSDLSCAEELTYIFEPLLRLNEAINRHGNNKILPISHIFDSNYYSAQWHEKWLDYLKKIKVKSDFIKDSEKRGEIELKKALFIHLLTEDGFKEHENNLNGLIDKLSKLMPDISDEKTLSWINDYVNNNTKIQTQMTKNIDIFKEFLSLTDELKWPKSIKDAVVKGVCKIIFGYALVYPKNELVAGLNSIEPYIKLLDSHLDKKSRLKLVELFLEETIYTNFGYNFNVFTTKGVNLIRNFILFIKLMKKTGNWGKALEKAKIKSFPCNFGYIWEPGANNNVLENKDYFIKNIPSQTKFMDSTVNSYFYLLAYSYGWDTSNFNDIKLSVPGKIKDEPSEEDIDCFEDSKEIKASLQRLKSAWGKIQIDNELINIKSDKKTNNIGLKKVKI